MACEENPKVVLETPIGTIETTSCQQGIHSIHVKKCTVKEPNKSLLGKVKIVQGKPDKYNDQCIEWFEDFFSGKIQDTNSVTLCEKTWTPFQKKAYTALADVLPGQRMTYGELSEKICGSTKSARAVGTAMKKNPQVIVIPCHRLIHSSGNIDKYSADGGSCLKSALLNHESSIDSKSAA